MTIGSSVLNADLQEKIYPCLFGDGKMDKVFPIKDQIGDLDGFSANLDNITDVS